MFNFKGILAGILLLVLVVLVPNIVENQDASELMVIQSVSGDLNVFTEPGPHWQGFGKVTYYPRQAQYSFCSISAADKADQLCENANSPSKKLRFNDGGHANLNGFVMWEMPTDSKSIIEIHKRFGSAESVQNRAVAKMIDGAVYLAGPLMSSTESSGSRRSELVQYINDQAENGVYVTHSENVTAKDPITGQEKTDSVTKIAMGSNGLPARQQGSVLAELGIKLQPMSISELKYDSIVEKQIAERQKAITQVQNARANALRAEQDAITVAKQGEADAAKAKWEQEVIKAKLVTEAQQKLEVAQLATKEAEQFKQAEILKGQGEAERKRLVMSADGALDPKLKAYIEVNAKYADAIANYKGNWVPGVVMGDAGGKGGNGAQDMINLLSVKTAKELGLDMTMKSK
jgi:regulator of protease activity HflC (stomatin/prohibitin superfamily)